MRKICMVLDREFPPDLRVENEIETLQSAGYEVHLLCFTRIGRSPEEKRDNFTLHRKSINNLIYKSSVGAITFPFYFNFWRKFLNEILSKQSFDALHIHDLPLLRIGVEMKNKYHIPLISDLHENWPAYLRIAEHTKSIAGRILSPDRKWISYEKKFLMLVDQIIVVVDEAKDRLIKLGLNPDCIHIVSNTLNIKNFELRETTSQNDETILFYAGGLNYHRGLQTVFYALEKIKRNNPVIRLWILGEGSYKNELVNLSKRLGIEEMVSFLGWQPYHKMIEMLMMANFALIPHLRSDHTDSTIPHKLFQYMYAKKPVISSNCKPLERIIRETQSGYVYESDNVEKLTEILEGLSNQNNQMMGNYGRKWVEEKYNWEADSKVFLEIHNKTFKSSDL